MPTGHPGRMRSDGYVEKCVRHLAGNSNHGCCGTMCGLSLLYGDTRLNNVFALGRFLDHIPGRGAELGFSGQHAGYGGIEGDTHDDK